MAVLIATCTDGRGSSPGHGSHATATVVEMMETVEVVAGRIGGHPDAVWWRHGHGRAMHVELIDERGVQFGYGGHHCADATGRGINVILSGGCGRFIVPVLLLLLLLVVLLVLLMLVVRLMVIVHVV